MSANSDYYFARAAECARDAEKADLVNVRDRFLRSEAAWLDMAERVQSTEEARDRTAAERALSAELANEMSNEMARQEEAAEIA